MTRDNGITAPEMWRVATTALVSVVLAGASVCPAVAGQIIEALPMRDLADDRRQAAPAAVSFDGRLVAFESNAPLVDDDTNGERDVYLLDRQTRTLTLVSRDARGRSGDGASSHPTISADGSRVAFESVARTLTDDPDDGALSHVYVFDARTGMVRRVGNDATPGVRTRTAGARLSRDGHVVVFHAKTKAVADACGGRETYAVFRHDLTRDRSERVTPSCVGAYFPSVSGDGSLVAYVRRESASANEEVWLYDATTGEHARLVDGVGGTAPDGPAYAPALSADGRWLTFVSQATNLTGTRHASADAQVYLRRVDDGSTLLLSATRNGRPGNGPSGMPAITDDGLHVVFHSVASNLETGRTPADVNLVSDVFRWSLADGAIRRLSRSEATSWLDVSDAPATSGDGRVVVFRSRHPVDAQDDRASFDLFLEQR